MLPISQCFRAGISVGLGEWIVAGNFLDQSAELRGAIDWAVTPASAKHCLFTLQLEKKSSSAAVSIEAAIFLRVR